MGRRRTIEERAELAEQVRALREAGRTRREIVRELGITEDLAKALSRGSPVAPGRRGSRADLRQAAVALRRAGRTYAQISAELAISTSTCSEWLRDVPRAAPSGPEEVVAAGREHDGPQSGSERRRRACELRREGRSLAEIASELGVTPKTAFYWTWCEPLPARARRGGDAEHMRMMRRRYWDRVLAEREAERVAVKSAEARRVGDVTGRELELLAVVAYWCEGQKDKAYARRETVTFINSDPALIRLFLAYLDAVEFPREHRRLSLSIHESADLRAATDYWAEVAGVRASDFRRPVLKRHNPRTSRKNTSTAYVGCLVVRLVQCRTLYQRIEGVWQGIMAGLALPPPGHAVHPIPGRLGAGREPLEFLTRGSNPPPGADGAAEAAPPRSASSR